MKQFHGCHDQVSSFVLELEEVIKSINVKRRLLPGQPTAVSQFVAVPGAIFCVGHVDISTGTGLQVNKTDIKQILQNNFC